MFLQYLLFRLLMRVVFWVVLLVALAVVFTGHANLVGLKGLVDGVTKAAHGIALSPSISDARTGEPSDRSSFLGQERINSTRSIDAGFSPGNAESMVVSIISSARSSIDVAAYSFTSRPIAVALVRAKRRGVHVRVVMDKSQETERYTSATFLVNEGIPVRIDRQYAIMHNKFMVVDGVTVETGSFNFTSSAAHRNAENVLIVHGDPGLARTYASEWSRLWAESSAYRTSPASPKSG